MSWRKLDYLDNMVYASPLISVRSSGCIADILLNMFAYDPLAKTKKLNELSNIPCFKSRFLHCGYYKLKIVYVKGSVLKAPKLESE